MKIVILVIIILAIVGWYMFRPERIFIDSTVNEALPEADDIQATTTSGPKTLSNGTFHGVAHEAKGNAEIIKLSDGKKILRFTDFAVSNGPDVVVYLSSANDANDSDTIKNSDFVLISELKGNIGDQNYEIPGDLDLSKYNSAVIWCRRFGVNFAVAPLKNN